MELTIRQGDQADYPLPVASAIGWQQHEDKWRTTVSLPDLPKAQIIVPSFSIPGADYSYRFTASVGNEPEVPLLRIPQGDMAKVSSKFLSTHIDCWHTEKKCREVRIHLTVADIDDSSLLSNALLVISTRPLSSNYTLPQGLDVHARPPILAHSQMQAPANISKRICSPTALAMATNEPWPLAIRGCYHRQTNSFGCWPLAVYWAGQRNHLGAVETATNFDNAAIVLASGTPIVCSIRYGAGKLNGAPQSQTGGHLVTLTGLADDQVEVFDPAAADHQSVRRTYKLEEFAEAWLRHRGAAYIFSA